MTSYTHRPTLLNVRLHLLVKPEQESSVSCADKPELWTLRDVRQYAIMQGKCDLASTRQLEGAP